MLGIPKTPGKNGHLQPKHPHIAKFQFPLTPMPQWREGASIVQDDVTLVPTHTPAPRQMDMKRLVAPSFSESEGTAQKTQTLSPNRPTPINEHEDFGEVTVKPNTEISPAPLLTSRVIFTTTEPNTHSDINLDKSLSLLTTPETSTESKKQASTTHANKKHISDKSPEIVLLSDSDQSDCMKSLLAASSAEMENSTDSADLIIEFKNKTAEYEECRQVARADAGEDSKENSVIIILSDSEDEFVLRPPPIPLKDSPQPPRPSSETLYRPMQESPAPRPLTADPAQQKHLHVPPRKRIIMKCTLAKTPHCARPTKAWLNRINFRNGNKNQEPAMF